VTQLAAAAKPCASLTPESKDYTMTTSQTPFTAILRHGSLTVAHLVDGRSRALCLVDLARPYSILLDGPVVSCRTPEGHARIQSPEGTDAGDLLNCISAAVMHHEKRRKILGAALAGVLAVAFATMFAVPTFLESGGAVDSGSAPAHREVAKNNKPQSAVPLPVMKPSEAKVVEPAATAALPAQDGWTLPKSIREGLPAKLQMAAERKIFTVEYSSGHARTLYVFADPECPNCQRLEPALEAAAKGFNVVVFPVAVIGREKSIASITPVLCLPSEQRKAAWSNLFDIGNGVMDLGKPAIEGVVEPGGNCDIAGKALGVNEVAYQTYRIPGTPWVIADDGRYVSQDVLQNPLKLQAFMSENAAEVSHAAQ